MDIKKLREKNSMPIYSVHDNEFNDYGKIIDFDFTEIHKYLESETEIPEFNNIYVACDNRLEKAAAVEYFKWQSFGGADIQAGYCNGNSHMLGMLEWHNCPEINYAVTDMAIMLAGKDQIKQGKIDSSEVKVFFIPKGTGIVLSSGVMHSAPCAVETGGFRCLVVLSEGTNMPISRETIEKFKPLKMKNKWMLCHKDRKDLIESGAVEGIEGENIILHYI